MPYLNLVAFDIGNAYICHSGGHTYTLEHLGGMWMVLQGQRFSLQAQANKAANWSIAAAISSSSTIESW